MNRHIEQTDRGIVITKALAWTMITTVLAGGLWVGAQVASVQTQIEQISIDIERMQLRSVETERRVNINEQADARTEVILQNQTMLLERIDDRLRLLDDRLRQQEQQLR